LIIVGSKFTVGRKGQCVCQIGHNVVNEKDIKVPYFALIQKRYRHGRSNVFLQRDYVSKSLTLPFVNFNGDGLRTH
jgi:hypothetical protein